MEPNDQIADKPVGLNEDTKIIAHWSDLVQEEKIERMRHIVKSLKDAVERQSRIIDKLMGHSHNQQGRIVTDLFETLDDRYPMPSRIENGDDVYF